MQSGMPTLGSGQSSASGPGGGPRGRAPHAGGPLTAKELAQRAESLIRHSSNRYLPTVRIAFRAKQRRFDDFDGLLDEVMIKPVQRAIIELSDEQDQPDLLPG